jgi:hypothetical protein
LSGVTTYVEGAKGVTEDRQLYGSEATVGGSVGYEARVGVALEWDPSGYACETEE